MMPQPFTIRFENGNVARAVRAPAYADASQVLQALDMTTPRPALFLSGGASAMGDAEMQHTQALVRDGIARFAADHGITVVDGGTDAGIMKMMGQARHHFKGVFPLVGCAPMEKVIYPGGPAREDNEATPLESHHSHFVLVDGDYWGVESDMIVGVARALPQTTRPTCGILINGGQISQYDVYIASARGEQAVPVIVIDGSGRTADMIASATKSGNFNTAMIKAIVEGGRIDVLTLNAGPDALYERLQHFFKTAQT